MTSKSNVIKLVENPGREEIRQRCVDGMISLAADIAEDDHEIVGAVALVFFGDRTYAVNSLFGDDPMLAHFAASLAARNFMDMIVGQQQFLVGLDGDDDEGA